MITGVLIVLLGSATAGNYDGKITLHSVDSDPEVRKKLEPVLSQARSIKISLCLRPDGTYELNRAKGSVFPAEIVVGRWAKLDSTLALMPSRVNNQPAKRPSQLLQYKKSSWVMKLEPAGDLRGEIIFVRSK